jgi:hypothetical protein
MSKQTETNKQTTIALVDSSNVDVPLPDLVV